MITNIGVEIFFITIREMAAFYAASKTGATPPMTEWPKVIEDPGHAGQKFRASIFTTILFCVLFNTNVHAFINSVVSLFTSNAHGVIDELGSLTGQGYFVIGSVFWFGLVYFYRTS